jgi:hypothetical protein
MLGIDRYLKYKIHNDQHREREVEKERIEGILYNSEVT